VPLDSLEMGALVVLAGHRSGGPMATGLLGISARAMFNAKRWIQS
jgi:hypothetical protein